jgi:hypothetical protein
LPDTGSSYARRNASYAVLGLLLVAGGVALIVGFARRRQAS